MELLEKISLLKIPILQYRNKFQSLQEKKEDLTLIRKYYHGKLIINDSIELIEYADGIHLGQEDIATIAPKKEDAIKIIRQKIGTKILGISTHNKKEIEEANTLNIDYIGLGAYRQTATKEDANVGGESLIKIAKISKHPIGIIGGVRIDDIFPEYITYKVIGSGLYE